MKQKNALALAAWNLYPLTRDPAVVSFLLKNDGDDILDVARELLAQSWQGAPDTASTISPKTAATTATANSPAPSPHNAPRLPNKAAK